MNKKKAIERTLGVLPYFFAPLLVLAVLLYVFKQHDMYPFGDGTVSWCDMNQQTIPLLIDFKDILDGKSGLFFNLNNAAGMNFYGVFFFFLASPFSLLVKFVDKSDMITFVNILVMLKLMTASITSVIYFRSCRKELNPAFAVILSVMYALCGYGMLFYQNIIWLDMMYLLPLLVLALNKLVTKQNNIPYIIVITAMLAVNYYISYMIVVFLLIFIGLYAFTYPDKEKKPLICTKFISGSLIGALLSAVIWIPCFTQYLSSGRRSSITETITDEDFISHYETVLPLLFCTAFIFVVAVTNAVKERHRSDRLSFWMRLFALLLLPFFIEPINLMWHTGNYMAFPARYGFITIFAGLIVTGDCLARDEESYKAPSRSVNICAGLGSAFVICLLYKFVKEYVTSNFDTLTDYPDSLWGSSTSFEGLFELFVIVLIVYAIVYFLFTKQFISKKVFAVLLCAVCVIESASSTEIYMTFNAQDYTTHTEDFQKTLSVADKIDDDSFYRVLTNYKIMDYNTVGALGYASLSHYTSLTDKDFMYLQKHLGYTTVWMEVGSMGGTELTNALYCVKYKILHSKGNSQSYYQGDDYSIEEYPYFLGMGVITDSSIYDYATIPTTYTRAQAQEYVYEALYGTDDKIITEYPIDKSTSKFYKLSNNQYNINSGATINYTFTVKGRQSLYADCFNTFSNNLSEDYFDSLSITVNNTVVAQEYPTKTYNGLVCLGEFEDTEVTVSIHCSKDISCYSFGVFGLDLDLLEEKLESTSCANLTATANGFTGTYTSDGESSVLLSVPYEEGFTVKVNGKKVEYSKVLSDFIAFDIEDGENEIEITFKPKGFTVGLALTLLGIAAFAAYIVFRKRIHTPDKVLTASSLAACFIGLAAIGFVYLFPIILKIMSVFESG